MRYRNGHEAPGGAAMRTDRRATEQSSMIGTSGTGGETDAEGLEDGELLRSKHSRASTAASRLRQWP